MSEATTLHYIVQTPAFDMHYNNKGEVIGIKIYAIGGNRLFALEAELREQIAQEIEAVFNWNRIDIESQMTRLGMLNKILIIARGK